MMDQSTTAVLIAERDSDWLAWAVRLRSAGIVRVVAQREDETSSRFATRVRAELADVGDVDTAVLAGAGQHDGEALASRALMVQALASHMNLTADGRILLDGGDTDRGRFAMEALAAVVGDQLQATGVQIVAGRKPEAATPLAA